MKKIDFCCILVAFTLYVAIISTVCTRIVVNQAVDDILAKQRIEVNDLWNEIDEVPDRVEKIIKKELESRVKEEESDISTEVEEPVETPEPVVKKPVYDPDLTDKEIDLIALVTMAEAEDEPVEGKRLVIDTILNRVESRRFPNTVEGVIYQKNQFECMWNGRVNKCYVRDDIRQLVIEELQYRVSDEVLFFQMYEYNDFSTPLFRVGNHYFSKY